MVSVGGKESEILLCNDREHLLFYIESGCVEFNTGAARSRSIASPDYLVLAFDMPDNDPVRSEDVIVSIRTILEGLQLPAFLKADGISGLHIYTPLDTKSGFDTTREAAEYIGKLIKLRTPDRISLRGIDEYVYGRVTLDLSVNWKEGSVVAPYSLLAGDSVTAAVPLSWDDVEHGLVQESFDEERFVKKLKKDGDPLAALFKKKVNAEDLLERLEENYEFLF